MIAQRAEAHPRISHVRSNRNAAQRRRGRTSRARYVGLFRFCAALAIVLFCVMGYVTLVARLTGLSYAVAHAEHQRAALQAQTAHLDDQLAALRSDDRLARLAAALHMQAPAQFAIVALPAPIRRPERERVAFLSTLTALFAK